jgi:hypothetical protein
MTEKERLVDVVMYIMSLTLSAFRFARGLSPFDFDNVATAQFMTAKALPFLENGEVDYKIAHDKFLASMREDGWVLGPEDYEKRTHPDITPWKNLCEDSQKSYGYIAAIVNSAQGFYESLRQDLEIEFMSNTMGKNPLMNFGKKQKDVVH